MFYQLEYASPTLSMEEETINIKKIKENLSLIIKRDKDKYKNNKSNQNKGKKSTIYEKLDWFEKYLNTKHNRLNSDIADCAVSYFYKVN